MSGGSDSEDQTMRKPFWACSFLVVLLGLAAGACSEDPAPATGLSNTDLGKPADADAIDPNSDAAPASSDSDGPGDAEIQAGCQSDDQCKDFPIIVANCQKAVCNKTTGNCQQGLAEDGATCDDGKECTAGDKCDKSGNCSGQTACAALNAGTNTLNPCKVGSCGDGGKCEYANKDGWVCDDNNACTSGEVCVVGGKCGTGQPKVCEDDGNSCTVETCNSKTGDCSSNLLPDGTFCDPKDLCVGDPACDKGECKGTAVSCKPSSNPCAFAACDSLKGCGEMPVKDGTVCGPAMACVAGKCF